MYFRYIGKRVWGINNSLLVIFIGAIFAWLVSSFFLKLTLYEQILSVFVGVLLLSVLIFGISIILPFLLLLSIVSRGVFNLIGVITIFDVLLFVLFGSLTVKHIITKKGIKITKEGKMLIGLLLIVILTEVIGFIRFPELFLIVSFKPFLQFIEYLVVFLCVISMVKTSEDIKKYVNLEVFCGVLLASIVLYEAYFGVFTFGEQPIFSSTYYTYSRQFKINPTLMLLLIPTFWFIIFLGRKRPYLFGLIPLFIYVYILSSSRSLYLGILGGLVGMVYLRSIPKLVIVLIIGFVIVWFNLDFLAPKVNEVFESVFGYFTNPYALGETSTVGRLGLVETTLWMVLAHPFWGYGINGFGMELYSISGFKDYPGLINIFHLFGGPEHPFADTHNQYLQILADHGIVALILFSYLIVKLVRVCLNNYKKTNDPFLKGISQAFFVSLISFLFAFLGVVLLETDNNITPIIFWFNLGLIYSIKRVIENNGDKGFKPT